MSVAWHDASPTPFELGKDLETVERYTHPRPVQNRQDFRRWLETAIRDLAEGSPDPSRGSSLSGLAPQIWEFAVDCAARVCPECRQELGDTAPIVVDQAARREESRKRGERLLERLRAAYACTVGTVQSDADRLAEYLLNFPSRGHKAMITELWTKGYASFQRLANLRGKYSVTAHADRNAIYRLLLKAESVWAKERQIRIKKESSGLTLEKHGSDETGSEASAHRTSSPQEIDC
ncbi:MAG TPA: hypothetical protein VMR25_06900 [Planctomycetaceae bacterium]|jgi:hypothetical protein|nr:hypothetical protein [Planctomycetaceae bacterium]